MALACSHSVVTWGLDLRLRPHSDSTAASGVCRRRGLGKVRHLAVADLWLQDKVGAGDLTIHKVLGADTCLRSLSMKQH